MNRFLLIRVQSFVSLCLNPSLKSLLFFLFLAPFLVQAQCTSNPGIVSSGGIAVYFDVDDDGANDFAISRNSAFNITRLYVLGNEAHVYLGAGTEVVNATANAVFDGTETSYSDDSFQQYDLDQLITDWLIIFKYNVTLSGGVQSGIKKLGYLKISIQDKDMIVDEYGIQAPTDNDGILAGDCASLANSLPIELSYLKLRSNEDAIQLDWETQSEKSNAGFEIQRSLNAHDFETIAWVEGAGDSYTSLQYQYEDYSIRSNISYYYRLKNVNYDGSFEISPIVVGKLVNGKKDPVSPFFPNPVMEQATKLQFVAEQDQTVQINLYNAVGKHIKSQEHFIVEGGNVVELETADLLSGNYFAIIQMGDAIYQQKLIVSK